MNPPKPHHHAPTHAPTHARPSLPVNQEPNPTSPNRGTSRLHDTAAIGQRWCSKDDFPLSKVHIKKLSQEILKL